MKLQGILHDVWIDDEGLTTLCFSGYLGEESSAFLKYGSKITYSFYAVGHYDAMEKYYEYMEWGHYNSEFAIDREPYNISQIEQRHKTWQAIDEILWNDWDPIGINDDLNARDEYQPIFRELFHLLMQRSLLMK